MSNKHCAAAIALFVLMVHISSAMDLTPDFDDLASKGKDMAIRETGNLISGSGTITDDLSSKCCWKQVSPARPRSGSFRKISTVHYEQKCTGSSQVESGAMCCESQKAADAVTEVLSRRTSATIATTALSGFLNGDWVTAGTTGAVNVLKIYEKIGMCDENSEPLSNVDTDPVDNCCWKDDDDDSGDCSNSLGFEYTELGKDGRVCCTNRASYVRAVVQSAYERASMTEKVAALKRAGPSHFSSEGGSLEKIWSDNLSFKMAMCSSGKPRPPPRDSSYYSTSGCCWKNSFPDPSNKCDTASRKWKKVGGVCWQKGCEPGETDVGGACCVRGAETNAIADMIKKPFEAMLSVFNPTTVGKTFASTVDAYNWPKCRPGHMEPAGCCNKRESDNFTKKLVPPCGNKRKIGSLCYQQCPTSHPYAGSGGIHQFKCYTHQGKTSIYRAPYAKFFAPCREGMVEFNLMCYIRCPLGYRMAYDSALVQTVCELPSAGSIDVSTPATLPANEQAYYCGDGVAHSGYCYTCRSSGFVYNPTLGKCVEVCAQSGKFPYPQAKDDLIQSSTMCCTDHDTFARYSATIAASAMHFLSDQIQPWNVVSVSRTGKGTVSLVNDLASGKCAKDIAMFSAFLPPPMPECH